MLERGEIASDQTQVTPRPRSRSLESHRNTRRQSMTEDHHRAPLEPPTGKDPEKRARILAAARTILAARRYDDVPVSEITELAGVEIGRASCRERVLMPV